MESFIRLEFGSITIEEMLRLQTKLERINLIYIKPWIFNEATKTVDCFPYKM